MKKILGLLVLVAFLIPAASFGQKSNKSRKRLEKKALKYFSLVFEQEHKMFSNKTVPEEFQEESMIVLGQQVHLALLRNTETNGNSTRVALRKRVYLNDDAAVENYSEFYYQNSDVIGITIIKPDGSEKEVELSDAVKVTTDVPKYYQDKFQSSDYFKIAIPALQVGDIVDFYKVFNESYQGFVELAIPVGSESPIVEQEIIFDVDKLWSAYYNSYNGAPKLILDPKGGLDIKGRQRKSVKRLVFNSKNTPVERSDRWSYDMLNMPLIKFMALPPGVNLGNKEQVSTDLDEEELFKITVSANLKYISVLSNSYAKRIKAMNLIDKSEEDAADIIYRLFRTVMLREYYKDMSLTDFSHYLSRAPKQYPSAMFVCLFAELLDKVDIASEIVMVSPRSKGDLANTLLFSEHSLGVYVPSIQKYFWPTDNFLLPGDIPSHLEGAKGFKINYKEINKRNKSFQPVTVPNSNIEDNKYVFDVAVNVDSNNELKMDAEMTFSGYYRESYSPLFLYNTHYLKDEIKMIKSDMTTKEIKKGKKSGKNNKGKSSKGKSIKNRKNKDYSFAMANEKEEKEKKEVLEDWIKEDYEFTEFGGVEILDNGMTSEGKELKVTYTLTSDSYVKKAGPNLVFSIGKLIGGQVQLDEKEIKDRTVGVDFASARVIENNLTITIPEGKSAKGLEELNMNVSNDIGEFVSTVEQIGNVISIKTLKKYKKISFALSDWPKMVEFLEAAFQFTEKKIILK